MRWTTYHRLEKRFDTYEEILDEPPKLIYSSRRLTPLPSPTIRTPSAGLTVEWIGDVATMRAMTMSA
jgi:hypothetical protein